MGRAHRAGTPFMNFAVGLAGYRGSGKSTLAAQLAREYNFSQASFGRAIRQEAKARGLEPTIEVLQALGPKLIKEWGWDRLCRVVLDQSCADRNIVIEGI